MSFMHHSYLTDTEMVLTSIVSVVRHMCVKRAYKREIISGHKSVLPGALVEGIRNRLHDGLDFVENESDSHSCLGIGKLSDC